MTQSIAQLVLDTDGELIGPADAGAGIFHGVSSDTRRLRPGQLYVALRGPNFDGADFLAAARDGGAIAALAERAGPADFPVVRVADSLQALQRAARLHRARCDVSLIAVAGSNGKTTCKEMLAAILAQRGPTLATRGNLNNHIGVPLTLLEIQSQHRHAVIELGANHPGEVAVLAALAKPNIGIVTNAGAEHLEGFGSIEGAARAEGELFAALSSDGVAVLNADDVFADLWRGMTDAQLVSFGLGAKADYSARAVSIEQTTEGFITRFVLLSPRGEMPVTLHLAGKHNVLNALGAAAAAMSAGASLQQVAAGLAVVRAVSGRLQLKRSTIGAWVIDDSYNANPSSMQAAIDVLETMPGERWMVMGDMGELGEFAPAAHRDIGRYARGHGIARLWAIGEHSRGAVQEFGPDAVWHEDITGVVAELHARMTPEVCLLIKGSRANRLERLVEALCGKNVAGVH